MSKTLFLTVVLFSLAGCATSANYVKILNTWVGATELNLLRAWGVPQQSYNAGGRKFMIYSNSRNFYIPEKAPTYQTTVIGNTAYTKPVGGTAAANGNADAANNRDIVASKMTASDISKAQELARECVNKNFKGC